MVNKYLVKDNTDDKFKLKNLSSNYTTDIYDGESDNLYEILTYYQEKYKDDWIDVRIGKITGHLIEINQWIEYCEEYFFTDDDGSGSPLDENFNFIGWLMYPSERNILTQEVKYILWFNK